MEKYPNDVKIVIKNFPLSFHKLAMRAAQYSLAAAKQGKYKEMYHAIMKDYKILKTDPDFPVQLAADLGLDVEQFKRDADDPAINAQIEKEIKQLRNSGIARLSVPKFLVAGKVPKGKRTIESFSALIDEALKKE